MQKVVIGGVVLVLTIVAGVWYSKSPSVAFREQRAFIADKLRDPESAQFRNEHIGSAGALCGEVNSRNGSGGYAGFTRFISRTADDVRLEGQGSLGETSTQEIIDTLSLQRDLISSFVELRKRMPDIAVPSEREFEERARDAYFKKRWSESCGI